MSATKGLPFRSRLIWRELRRSSQRPSCLEGGGQGAVVEVIEFAADRDALGEARDAGAGQGGAVSNVMRRRLALDRGVERQDQLGIRAEPGNQPGEVQLVRADPVERRQRAAEHMVAAAKGAGALQGPEV